MDITVYHWEKSGKELKENRNLEAGPESDTMEEDRDVRLLAEINHFLSELLLIKVFITAIENPTETLVMLMEVYNEKKEMG